MVLPTVVLLALVMSGRLARVHTPVRGRRARVVTGVGFGLGPVLGGVGGPAATVYAVLSQWSPLAMVATLQPLWTLVSAVSVGAKWAMDDGQLPDLAWWVWVAMLGCVIASVWIGELVQERIGERGIGRTVVVLGFIGALLSLWTGLRLLLT